MLRFVFVTCVLQVVIWTYKSGRALINLATNRDVKLAISNLRAEKAIQQVEQQQQ